MRQHFKPHRGGGGGIEAGEAGNRLVRNVDVTQTDKKYDLFIKILLAVVEEERDARRTSRRSE